MTDLAKLLKRPSRCVGDTSWKFQGPTACLTGSSMLSLPMPCSPPSTSAWLIFSPRALHPVRQPVDDVVGVVWEDPVDVVDPGFGLAGVAQLDARRPVQVEAGHALALDPAAVDHQPVLDEHRHGPGTRSSARPRWFWSSHRVAPHGDELAVLVALRLAGLGQHRNAAAGSALTLGPAQMLAARREDVHCDGG